MLVPVVARPAGPAFILGWAVIRLAAAARRDRERGGHVGELAGAVQLAVPVGACRPVRQIDLHLGHPQAAAQQVDGERGLRTEAPGERARRLERRPRQASLAIERLGGLPARRPLDARGRTGAPRSRARRASPGSRTSRSSCRRSRRGRARSADTRCPRSPRDRRQGTAGGAACRGAPRRRAAGPPRRPSPSPHPCRGSCRAARHGRPPASAAPAVPSRDPSSTTITRSTPDSAAADVTVA